MAANGALLWLPSELRTAGCKVQTVRGWKERGRPASSGPFDPFGVLWHHTGAHTSKSNPMPSLGILVRGRSDLPGPLCQLGIGFDGIIRVIAAGRANHAGTNRGSGPIPAGDGNAQMVGIEFDYSGSQDMSDEQMEAGIKATPVILKHFRKDHSFTRGHKETSTAGKWDPGRNGSSSPQYLMDEIRADIKAALDPPKVRFVLMDGEGKELAHSASVEQGSGEGERLETFLNNRRGLILRELRADRDAALRRVKV